MSAEPPDAPGPECDETAKLKALRRDIQVGLDQIARGEVAHLDMGAIRAEVRAGRDARPVPKE
jgi:hypothetical protein